MLPIAENFDARNKASDDRRKCYVEAKLGQKGQQPEIAARETEQIINYLHKLEVVQRGNRIFDLGCGTGRITVELAKHGYDAHGTDINPDFIEIARDKASKGGVSAHFMTAPAKQLPFDDSFFDICIVISVLEHVADWRKEYNQVRPHSAKGYRPPAPEAKTLATLTL